MERALNCKRLTGKVALITGAASGIGKATAQRFIAEGARVAIVDINLAGAEALASQHGDAALAIACDAEDVTQIEAAVAETVRAFGRLDILYNNAALVSPDVIKRDTTPTDIDFAIWDKTFAVNLRGYLAGCKYAIPHMIAQGSGSIIMTSSGSGVTGDLSNVAYGSSKAAVNNLVRYVATIYGKQGVRCNAISPGLIRTEGGKKNVHGPMVEIMEANTLAPRLGQPEDIAAMAAFLAADEFEFVTGQVIAVDGGMMAHAPYISDILGAALGWDTDLAPHCAHQTGMKGELTPDLIVDVATAMARSTGFDDFSLRPLAARMGVSATALYYHVKDKSTLLEWVARRLFEPIGVPDASLPWTEQMRAFLLSQNELLHNVPGLARFLIQRRDCDAAQAWRAHLTAIIDAAGFQGEARDAALSVFSFYIDPTTLVSTIPGEKPGLDMTFDHHQPGRTYIDYYRLGLDQLLRVFDRELNAEPR